MIPREKAKELIDKFLRYVPAEEELELPYAIQCAKIAVEEILKALEFEQIELQAQERMKCMLNFRMQDYYKEVLKEITEYNL